jgi:uncharacterized protein (DUF1330 family)
LDWSVGQPTIHNVSFPAFPVTKYLVALLLLACCPRTWGQQRFDPAYGKPIVVLIEAYPWLMVVGSDVPSFALYENGQVIYQRRSANRVEYVQVQHDRAQTQALIKTLGITDSLLRGGTYFNAADATDQPTNTLLLNFDSVKQIQVYGSLRSPQAEDRARTPKDFLTVYDRLIYYDDPAAKAWLPDSIEVMATAYSYSPVKPLPWDPTWHDLKSPTTVKRSEELYSIYLPKSQYDALLQLRRRLKEKQAVLINGGKYSLSYRLPFPNLR